MTTNTSLQTFAHLTRFREYQKYNTQLYNISKFPKTNIYTQGNLSKIILNFSFKRIDFNKKRALPFFFAMELLTNQKCIATLSSKNVLIWKLRKGALVGCKVTLRATNLANFLDNLNLALPRMEKFKPLKLASKKQIKNNFLSLNLTEILLFYPIEIALGINSEIKEIEIKFLFNSLSQEEKLFLLLANKIPTIG